MGTVIERVVDEKGGWRTSHSALRLAVVAAKDCLRAARRSARDVDLLINAGVYRDRNLGEPALAAMIQQDIGANPEDPHDNAHGTFSFDVLNGTCGPLTALQIVDGFMKSRTIEHALIIASDANPGHGMSENFPFSPTAAALLCTWTDDDYGLGRVHWSNVPDGGENFRATVGLAGSRNVLRFATTQWSDERFAAVAAQAAQECLGNAQLTLDDVETIVAAPAHGGYRSALAGRLGVEEDRIVVADVENTHTASLPAAFRRATKAGSPGGRVLLIAAGAGITAGAALYRMPPGQL
jgi:3-oxoacyl-[acyl-carrier-protein] synthase-3